MHKIATAQKDKDEEEEEEEGRKMGTKSVNRIAVTNS
jgi:hypothetical protein